jgi:hypothetical protein
VSVPLEGVNWDVGVVKDNCSDTTGEIATEGTVTDVAFADTLEGANTVDGVVTDNCAPLTGDMATEGIVAEADAEASRLAGLVMLLACKLVVAVEEFAAIWRSMFCALRPGELDCGPIFCMDSRISRSAM